jgi:hypothetical protein
MLSSIEIVVLARCVFTNTEKIIADGLFALGTKAFILIKHTNHINQ